jgi:signal transduction histidine kinase
LNVDLDVDLAHEAGRESTRLVSQIEDTLYRVVQEALANVVKHARASQVEIVVRERISIVEAVVGDNGSGFDPEAEHAGFGLLGMRERVALAGGTLTVESTVGEGTTVRISFPAQRATSGEARSAAGA